MHAIGVSQADRAGEPAAEDTGDEIAGATDYRARGTSARKPALQAGGPRHENSSCGTIQTVQRAAVHDGYTDGCSYIREQEEAKWPAEKFRSQAANGNRSARV